MHSESGGADTLSRIQRGSYDFPEHPVVSPEAKDFVGKVRTVLVLFLDMHRVRTSLVICTIPAYVNESNVYVHPNYTGHPSTLTQGLLGRLCPVGEDMAD